MIRIPRPRRAWLEGDRRAEVLALLGLLIAGLVLHTLYAVYWDQLRLSSAPGNDDEGYFFLAYQILGEIPEAPLFFLRLPGWPFIIAGLLAIFGVENAGVVLILHRLILGLFPVLVYLALRPFLPRKVALIPALLVAFLHGSFWSANRAYTEVVYFATGLTAILALIRGVATRAGVSWPWISVAAAALLVHSAVRPTGLWLTLGLSVVAAAVARATGRIRAAAFAGLTVPTLLFAFGLGLYHYRQTGVWRLLGLRSGVVLSTYALSSGVDIPESPAVRRIQEVLPEVPHEHLFATTTDLWLAQYRLALASGDIFYAYDVLNEAGSDVVRANALHYGQWLLRHVVLWILDPYPELAPEAWTARRPAQQAGTYRPPLPSCSYLWLVGPVATEKACHRNEELRGYARWEVVDLPPVFAETRFGRWREVVGLLPRSITEGWSPGRAMVAYMAVGTRMTAPYFLKVQDLAYFSLWGVFTVVALSVLLWYRPTRLAALLLSAGLLAEAMPFLIFGDPWQGRWYRYLDVYRYLANWLALGLLIVALRARITLRGRRLCAALPAG